MEADLYARHHPERADVIDGTIGRVQTLRERLAATTLDLALRAAVSAHIEAFQRRP